VIGLLRVMFDARITLQQQVSEQLKGHFGEKVFNTVIPRNVRLAEAPSYGLPGVVFDPASKGAQAFIEFAREMAQRVEAMDVGRPLRRPREQWSGSIRPAVPHRGRGNQCQRPAQQRWVDGWLVRFSPARPSAPVASTRRTGRCRSKEARDLRRLYDSVGWS
jgi:hypothetical protein